MISLLIGLAFAGDAEDERWRAGYAAGQQAAEEQGQVGRCGAASFAVGLGSAAVGTALLGPCIGGPLVVAGAFVPQIVAVSNAPRPDDFAMHSRRYQRGYDAGYRKGAGMKRWGAAAVGGMAGAAIGTVGAYATVGIVMRNQGFEPGPFIPEG